MPGQKQEADRRGRTGRIIVPALPLVLCGEKNIRGGDCIGRVLVIEFNESDLEVFDKVMEVLQQDSKTFEMLQVKKENADELTEVMEGYQHTPMCGTELKKTIEKYRGKRKLSKEIVEELVEKVLIHEDKRIEVVLKYDDEMKKLLMAMEQRKGEMA